MIAPTQRAVALRTPSQRWFGRRSGVVAWVILAFALVHPAHGLGLPICMWRAAADVPCPGCGMARSLSCTLRGDITQACAYHPFGPIFAGLFVVMGVVGYLPESARGRFMACLDRHGRWTTAAYVTLIGAFLVFGAVRALVAFGHNLAGGAPCG
ncbi:MAG: DUF2752 domain-containing protein [Phycisphaerae bacterium]|jgi:hypothetical protein